MTTLLQIRSLAEEHLEDAATLVAVRYDALREAEPRVPPQYSDPKRILPLLRGVLAGSSHGVAAIQGRRLAGFLTGWQIDSFRGERSIYSPEWASGAVPGDSRRIYEEMYSRAAVDWIESGHLAHCVSLLPTDRGALEAVRWMGFGMLAIDAIRGLDDLPGDVPEFQIRGAEAADLDSIVALDEALWRHVRSTPSFQPVERRTRCHYEELLQDPDRVIWVACSEGEPVAFMSQGPASEDACTVIRDPGTTSIFETFARESARGRGIATALLGHALQWARSAGYERCAVDWESMNLAASRFWLKHFSPVCYSLQRHIDVNAVWP